MLQGPKRKRLVLVAIIVVAVLAVAGGCRLLGAGRAGREALVASGTVEARVAHVSAEVSGRVVEVLVEEGQAVKAGQPLLRLDDAALQAQHAQAQASLQAAQANYSLLAAGATAEQLRQAQAGVDAAVAKLGGLKAGPRAEQVAQAQANVNIVKAKLAALERGGRAEQVAQAQANLAAAQSRLSQLRKGATAEEIDQAKLAIDQTKNALWAAQSSRDQVCGTKMGNCDAAKAQVATAETAVQKAELALVQLQKGAAAETIAQAEDAVRAAQAQYDLAKKPAAAEDLAQANDAVALAEAQLALAKQPLTAFDLAAAEAQVEAARAQLDALRAGARPEQLAAAQAQVALAQAQVQAVEVQLKKTLVAAPSDGVALTRSIEPGEMAAAGATLFVVGRLDSLEMTVYLPEEKYPLVTPNEQAQVRVDAYPERTFEATVLRIADKAEFTPRNVQTVEGRKDTVFAVRLSIANPDLALKPGLPADVTFGAP